MRDGGFVGSASGIHFIQTVYGTADAAVQHLVPGEDDALQNVSKSIWQESELTDDPFSFDDLITLTSSYFENWHPAFPYLHAPSILTVMERYPRVDAYDAIILQSIMSISTADSRQTSVRPVPRELVFDTFDHALESTMPALIKSPTLKSLQAVIAVQVFLVSMLRLNVASRIGGLIVKMAYQLGLHRCPTRYTSFTAEETMIRRRVLYTIYCLERHIAHALGLPLAIQDGDIDVCGFDNEEHGDTPELDNRLKLIAFLSRNATIRGMIMELRNKSVPSRDKNVDAATMISADLKRWWNEVEDFLELGTVSPLHRTVLIVIRHECVITLNRPLLASPKTSASYASGLQSCIAAAKAIISALHGSQIPLLWPTFTWATWMSSFILIYAAFEGQLAQEVALKLTEKALKVFEALAVRGSVWPNACATAIENLRKSMTERSTSSDDFIRTLGFAIPQTPQAYQDQAWQNEVAQSSTTATAQAVPETDYDTAAGVAWPDSAVLPKEVPLYSFNESDPFQGFDIPFWVGQDNYTAWSNNI